MLRTETNNPKEIDRPSIEKNLKEGKSVTIQFSYKSYSDEMLAYLNTLCLEYDDNFSVRFYAHDQNTSIQFYYEGQHDPRPSFDCKVLAKLPDVKSLLIECRHVENLEYLTGLKKLRRLTFGSFESKETEILQADNFQNLKELTIGPTRTKALNLEYLKNYTNLDKLVICGHTKNFNVVGKLVNLKYLGLTSISKVRLDFINNLKELKSLRFLLGGRENLEEIEENEIESLEIVQVRGFNSFRNLANFKRLEKLRIEDQIRLAELHFAKELPTLKNLTLFNCKTLKSVTGFENLSGLNELYIYETAIIFEELIQQNLPKSLNLFTFITSKTKTQEIKEKLLKLGYKCRLK
jgi:hypothetical protein